MANILALDDNLELCKLIRTALERDGHRVETRQAGGALTAGAGGGTSAAAEPHPGAPDGAQRRGL